MTLRKLSSTLSLSLLITNFCIADSATLTPEQATSYTLGVQTARSFHSHNIEIDLDTYMQGMRDIASDAPLKLTDASMTQILMDLQKNQAQQLSKQRAASAEKNQKAGEAFLEANKTKPGIQTFDSGIQYKIIVKGNGEKPSPTDTITVNYEGRLIDGTIFDSSYKRGQPATFPLNQVIKGWQEALTQMPTGSTWEIFIPSDLAYGDRGTPDGSIPAKSTLVFKVELIKIDK